MIARTARLGFVMAAGFIGVSSYAAAQLPSAFQTPGNKGRANEAQVCAADYEASVKPMAKWQRDQALERYGKRPEDFTGELDHLIPISLGGTNDPENLWPLPDNKTSKLLATSCWVRPSSRARVWSTATCSLGTLTT